jgi:hypothetical protein
MSALNNLADFITKLPLELQTEFMQLVDAVTDERDRLQNERISTSQATTGTFEVVAIAGTAETLLNDINVGDTVELNPQIQLTTYEKGLFYSCNIKLYGKYIVEDVFLKNDIKCVVINGKKLTAKYFHKVQTPSTNQHQTVSGC